MNLDYERASLGRKSNVDTLIEVSLQLKFKDGRLVSWKNDTGDLLNSGQITASGCGPHFPSGEVCSIGLWDDRTNCLFNGISLSAYPSFAVYEFVGGYDYAFIFSKGQGDQELRQIMIYRPMIGTIYSKEYKKSGAEYAPSAEYLLKFIRLNGVDLQFDIEKERSTIAKGILRLEKWMFKMKAKDFGHNLKRILWEDVPEKEIKPVVK